MGDKQEERLLELYEKGVLTKAEATACFQELTGDSVPYFAEKQSRFSFSLPELRLFSSSKQKQVYHFEGVESFFIHLTAGKVCLTKSKSDAILISLSYQQEEQEDLAPQLSVEDKKLSVISYLPCQLTISLPVRQLLSILDLNLGQADARLDFLPFEDITIYSQTDQKQQAIRLTTVETASQHLFLCLKEASVRLMVPKKQGVQARLVSQLGRLMVNKQTRQSPYFCEKSGQHTLYIRADMGRGSVTMKGVENATRTL